jgi:hypothetical protein
MIQNNKDPTIASAPNIMKSNDFLPPYYKTTYPIIFPITYEDWKNAQKKPLKNPLFSSQAHNDMNFP